MTYECKHCGREIRDYHGFWVHWDGKKFCDSSPYAAEPFHPWWDESKTGPAPNCEICGAMMVRGREALVFSTKDCVIGHRDADKGWECMSCNNYRSDQYAGLRERRRKA
jgi:hypothetical protein